MANEYTREELVKEAMKTIVLDNLSIRKVDKNTEDIIAQYGIEANKAYLCNRNYIVWGLFHIPYPEDKKNDILINGTQKVTISWARDIDGFLDISGYYPAEDNNLPFAIELEKPEVTKFHFHIGKYEFLMDFEKSDEVYRMPVSGYMGAATMREYYETIDEPVRYNELPVCDVRIGGVMIRGKCIGYSFGNRWDFSIELHNIKVDGEKISFDIFSDTYTTLCSVSLSEEKKEITVDGITYEMS